MSPLWKGRKFLQLKTIEKRPSPIHNHYISSFAQSFLFPNFILKNFLFSSVLSVRGKNLKNLRNLSGSIKGISLLISKGYRLPASMTVEAAMVLPLFLFFFLNLMYSIEMIRLHGNLQLALWETGNRMTVYGSVLPVGNEENKLQEAAEEQMQGKREEEDSWWAELAGVVWSYTYVKAQLISYLGEGYLEQSPLAYGVDGLQFLESNVWEGRDCFEVVVTYSVSPLCSISGFRPFRMANRYYGHLWTGYELPGTEDTLVYVAENGEVYHMNRNCTHLKLSVRQVTWQQAHTLKNARSKSYTACEKCGQQGMAALVYITDEGERYHFNGDCPGLKRTVACIALSKTGDLRACQRCVKEQ